MHTYFCVFIFFLIFYFTCAGSYGSMAKLRNITRMNAVGNNCVVGMSGDLADANAIKEMLEELE